MGITLRKKQLRDGCTSLYLDCCMNGTRTRKALGIILEKPDTKEKRTGNREKLKRAQQIKLYYEMESIKRRFQQCLPVEDTQSVYKTSNFFEAAQAYIEQYTRQDKRVLYAVIKHLHRFYPEKELPFHKLTHTFCTSFLYYLYQNLKGNTPISYFKRKHPKSGCLQK